MRWGWNRKADDLQETEPGLVPEPIFPGRPAGTSLPAEAPADVGGLEARGLGAGVAPAGGMAVVAVDEAVGAGDAAAEGGHGSGAIPAPAPAGALPAFVPGMPPGSGGVAVDAEGVVRALYRVLLRRDADEYGLHAYAAMLREGGTEGVAAVVARLLDSGEHRAVEAAEAVDAALARDVMAGRGVARFGPVRHVCSLGSTCYPAWLLQRMGLRRWSGPFDWLFGSVELVEHCLEDDFEAFLDADQIDALSDGRSTHRRYQGGITLGPVFNHRDATLPEHQAYHARCVARFRALLRSPEGKCFVMLLPGHPSWPDSRLLEDFHRVGRALAGRTENFRLLMVSHDASEGGLAAGLREVEARPDGALLRFRSASAMQGGLSFRQEWDNLALKRLLWSNEYDLAAGAPQG